MNNLMADKQESEWSPDACFPRVETRSDDGPKEKRVSTYLDLNVGNQVDVAVAGHVQTRHLVITNISSRFITLNDGRKFNARSGELSGHKNTPKGMAGAPAPRVQRIGG